MINRIACCIALSVISLAGIACTQDPSQPIGSQAALPAGAPTPLAPSAYRGEWVSNQIPPLMPAGKETNISITIKNAGDGTWPSIGVGGGPLNMVLVSYHWLPAEGEKPIVFDGVRTALPKDIAPGETVTIDKVHVLSPRDPGSYRLQVTLVQEGVSWFEGRGSKSLIVPVTVQ